MSRFVSGGTNDEPTERDEAWLQAQQELEAKRAARSAAAEAGKQDGGKTLYETLQANKAAKQEAFEESIRLKNQFRSLDEDEVAFLDEVLEGTRKKEEELRMQTRKDLDAFRRLQEEAEKSVVVAEGGEEAAMGGDDGGEWKIAGRKRKMRRDIGVVDGVKIRRTSSAAATAAAAAAAEEEKPPEGLLSSAREEDTSSHHAETRLNDSDAAAKQDIRHQSPSAPVTGKPASGEPKSASPASPTAAGGLGLAAYSSSEEDG